MVPVFTSSGAWLGCRSTRHSILKGLLTRLGHAYQLIRSVVGPRAGSGSFLCHCSYALDNLVRGEKSYHGWEAKGRTRDQGVCVTCWIRVCLEQGLVYSCLNGHQQTIDQIGKKASPWSAMFLTYLCATNGALISIRTFAVLGKHPRLTAR